MIDKLKEAHEHMREARSRLLDLWLPRGPDCPHRLRMALIKLNEAIEEVELELAKKT